jgi:chromosome segregation ATPase
VFPLHDFEAENEVLRTQIKQILESCTKLVEDKDKQIALLMDEVDLLKRKNTNYDETIENKNKTIESLKNSLKVDDDSIFVLRTQLKHVEELKASLCKELHEMTLSRVGVEIRKNDEIAKMQEKLEDQKKLAESYKQKYWAKHQAFFKMYERFCICDSELTKQNAALKKWTKYNEKLAAWKKEVFKCPISLDTMVDPVVAPNGVSYERAELMIWVEKHHTDPLTRSPLYKNQIYPNIALRNAIKACPSSIDE